MTITPSLVSTPFELVAVDLYRDIHKGIRAELFDVTLAAGRLDPADRVVGAEVAAHVQRLIGVLVMHAEHEDTHVQPVLESYVPALAEQVEVDHITLEARVVGIGDLADSAVDAAAADRRTMSHHLYLELAAFTGAYLAHQDLEERVISPQVLAAIGPEAAGAIHGAIVSSIPPDEMARSLAFMLPAMNIDDRAELLGGMRAGAPAEVFAGVWGLAGSVLAERDHVALGARLGLA